MIGNRQFFSKACFILCGLNIEFFIRDNIYKNIGLFLNQNNNIYNYVQVKNNLKVFKNQIKNQTRILKLKISFKCNNKIISILE